MVQRMKKLWIEIRGRWGDQPWFDWIVVAIVVAVHLLTISLTDRGWGILPGEPVPFLWELEKDDRMRVYTTVASVSALIFGFATASVSFFYGTAKGERIDLLKQVLSDQMVASWRAVLTAPLLAVAVCVLALLADTGSAGRVTIGLLGEAAMAILLARALRLRWLFTKTIGLFNLDITNPAAFAAADGLPKSRVLAGREER